MSEIFPSDVMTDKERAERLEAMVDRMSETIVDLRGELFSSNGLLRSFNSVCTRKGTDTNWQTLGAQIEIALQRQHPILYK